MVLPTSLCPCRRPEKIIEPSTSRASMFACTPTPPRTVFTPTCSATSTAGSWNTSTLSEPFGRPLFSLSDIATIQSRFSERANMATATTSKPQHRTLAEMVERLGDIPLERILWDPLPGTATEKDVLVEPGGNKRLCELVDGVLVEKPMGYFESRLGAILIHLIEDFLEDHDLGIVLGADATLGLAPRLVRLPDVAFISWKHFPNRDLPDVQILRQ